MRRSSKRRKTIEAYRKGDTIIVAIPARMSKREEERVVAEMVSKLGKDDLRLTSTELMARALELNSLYLGNKATPITVEWSSRMERIWGSCTIEERAIRLSNRLDDAPHYALDYILLHELVHLIVAGHGPDFKALLAGYPQLERAEGYLEGRQIRLEEDLVDAIDPIESMDPINPINPINPIDPIDSIAKVAAEVAAEVAEQVAITAIKGPRSSVATKAHHKTEGQLELISLAEISA